MKKENKKTANVPEVQTESKKITPAEIAYNLGYWITIAQEFYNHVNNTCKDENNR